MATLIFEDLKVFEEPKVFEDPKVKDTGMAPNALRDAGLIFARAIESGLASAIWDKASIVARQSVTREAFVDRVRMDARSMGVAIRREWRGMHLGEVPMGLWGAGCYATIEFRTTFSDRSTCREIVSFREDEDCVWRLAGWARLSGPFAGGGEDRVRPLT
ncbi:DUF4019 domain-containing protein [Dyella sp. C11]|uniref:DUF4019 domain-containing protein n=1 Tax=Dyella sp. C11 TaxID=2126991 RepID=UPI000D641CD7|nr:DUF4019 domain-containing protein [Dyella sp. C11]